MTSELFIENKPVDISADLSSLLTLAIDDVKDFASRQTTFSKTIIIPRTANNNQLFGNIFETGISNDYDPDLDNIGYNFNASKSARCLMFQDNIQSFKGTVRLLQINRDDYEIALNCELTGLNVALSSAYLDQLDFSAYDHQYSVANIIASWDNPGGSGYYYPLIDYGTHSVLKHDWDYLTFRPALYVKEYIDKMFANADFRYESDLFETARFKSLIIPHNSKNFKRPDTFKLNVSTSSAHYLNSDGNVYTASFPSHGTISDFNINPGSTVFEWTGADALTGDIVVNMGGTLTKSNSSPAFTAKLYINGLPVVTQDFGAGQTSGGWGVSLSITTALNPTDYIQVFISYNGGGTWDVTIFGTLTVRSLTDSMVDIVLTAAVPMNLQIPKNIKQIDFLVSIVKLFNLYIYEDKFDERLLYIKPFPDFYSTDSANAVDWTYKLNRDGERKIKPMSELNSKTYNFKYKDDSDYFNDQYKKRYNQGYGSYVFDSEFEFASQASSLELIFAATPLVGYLTEDKIYSTIFKRSGTEEEKIDSVIRILQSKKITGVTSWDILDDATVLDSVTEYGYAGHFDDPDNPGNDLNFGVLRELFFTLVSGDLTVTQFNVYYSAYMAEITDKDSKMFTGRFYLTPKDIFDLDFSKYVYLDAVLFRLNKITDYNATIPSDCEVQLLRVINTLY